MTETILASHWTYFTLGVFVGANVGFVVFAILNAGHRADEAETTAERIERRLDQASRRGHDQ